MTGMEMYENMDLKTNLDLTLDHKKPYTLQQWFEFVEQYLANDRNPLGSEAD